MKYNIEKIDRKIIEERKKIPLNDFIDNDEDKQKAIVMVRAQGKNLDPDYLMKRVKEERVTQRIKWLLKFQPN